MGYFSLLSAQYAPMPITAATTTATMIITSVVGNGASPLGCSVVGCAVVGSSDVGGAVVGSSLVGSAVVGSSVSCSCPDEGAGPTVT